MPTFMVDDIRLTRVGYFDVPLDPGVIGLTRTQVTSIPWGMPQWATADGRVLIGEAIWVIETDSSTIVIDPCGAADEFIRAGPQAISHQDSVVAALASAGFSLEQVDRVLLSHLDGIGMTAALEPDGTWTPLFPNATVELSDLELAHVRSHPQMMGATALLELMDQGVVNARNPPWDIAPGIAVQQTGGHSPGHVIARIGDAATMIGHLAISPLQAGVDVLPGQHHDAGRAREALEDEFAWAFAHRALVIGPLWPEPGAVRVTGPPWVVGVP